MAVSTRERNVKLFSSVAILTSKVPHPTPWRVSFLGACMHAYPRYPPGDRGAPWHGMAWARHGRLGCQTQAEVSI